MFVCVATYVRKKYEGGCVCSGTGAISTPPQQTEAKRGGLVLVSRRQGPDAGGALPSFQRPAQLHRLHRYQKRVTTVGSKLKGAEGGGSTPNSPLC